MCERAGRREEEKRTASTLHKLVTLAQPLVHGPDNVNHQQLLQQVLVLQRKPL